MADRCTPEERLVDPCQCALRDCLKDVGEAARAQRKIVFDLHYVTGELGVGPALQRLKEIKLIEQAGNAECVAEAKRCKYSFAFSTLHLAIHISFS